MRRLLLIIIVLLAAGLVSCRANESTCPPCPPCPACDVVAPTEAHGEAELEILQMTNKRDTIGNFIAMGIIENIGDATARQVEVACTAFGQGGGMVDTHGTYPELTTIGPGQRTTYTCYLDEVSPIATYECVVTWN